MDVKFVTWNSFYIYLIIASFFTEIYSSSIPKVTKVEAIPPLPLADFVGRNILTLQCAAEGNPSPELSWEFNGKKISNNFKYRVLKRGILQVFEVTIQDSGGYRCVATNSYGSTFGQLNVHAHALGDFKNGGQLGGKDLKVKATLGSQVNLTCPDHTEGEGRQYYWGELPDQGKPVMWGNGDVQPLAFIGEHGELIFSYLTEDHVNKINKLGGISCILYQLQAARVSVRISIEKDGEVTNNFKPRLYTHIKPQMQAVEGPKEEYAMVCGAAGRPHPKITWYKDGKEIEKHFMNSARPSMIFQSHSHMELRLKPVMLEHEGTYRCVAESSEGKDEKVGFLKVYSGPKWKKEFSDKTTATYGEKFKLECMAESIPASSYTWYMNNTKLTTVEEGRSINGGVLEFSSVNFKHGGLYVCAAENFISTTVTATFVTVQAVPPTFERRLRQRTYFFNH